MAAGTGLGRIPFVQRLDEELLELLRQQSGLSIDLEGRFCHQGEPIEHPRIKEVLWRSLRRLPDGRYLVSIGRESGYVRIDDAPYGVRGITFEARGPVLHLTDGEKELLDPATVRLDAEGVLHCTVKVDHRARFTRAAQLDLGFALEEDPRAPGRFLLHLGERTFPIEEE